MIVDVRMWIEWHNVRIEPSPDDFASTDGLCGYIHEAGNAQFRLRNQAVTDDMVLFREDWYVHDAKLTFSKN